MKQISDLAMAGVILKHNIIKQSNLPPPSVDGY